MERLLTCNYFILYILIVVTLSSITLAIIVPLPPTIIKQPPPDVLPFQVAHFTDDKVKPIILECEAYAEPEIKYMWTKNEQPFYWQNYEIRISQQPGRGTLVITEPLDEDEGYYRCFATNELGTAVTSGTFLRKIELNSFPDEPTQLVVVNEGDPLSLQCNPPTGFPKPTIFWVIQNDYGALRSINNSRITVDPERRLHFSNVTRDDSQDDAVYACSAAIADIYDYKLGNKIKIDLVPSSSPNEIRHPPILQYASASNIVAVEGETLLIYCIFSGTPLPEIQWKKKDTMLPMRRTQYLNYGKTLSIKWIRLYDEGIYECSANNGVGPAKIKTINVTIAAKPVWKMEPMDKRVAEGDDVELQCNTYGLPKPEIKWFINGEPLNDSKPNPRRKILSSTSIRIENLEKSDTAVYQCNVSNVHGYIFKNFYVNVLAIPPSIITNPEPKYEVHDGLTIKLSCRAFGFPKPVVEWSRNNKTLRGHRFTVLENGDLEIRNILFNDAGHYQCIATNKYGETKSNEDYGLLEVKIPYPPMIIKQPPPDFLPFQVAVGLDEKEKPFMLECEAKGEPKVDYRWTKNGQPFQWQAYDNRMFQPPGEGTLIITKPREDEGYYQCFAINEHGTAMSNGVFLRKSELDSFPDEPAQSVVVNEGDPLSLQCNPPAAFPKPAIFWIIQSDTGALKAINSSRITVDPEGRLHFSNVTRDDSQDDAVYACSASIVYRNEYKLGNKVKLDVLSGGSSAVQARSPPKQQFVSPPNIVAMKGESLGLYCIFSGTPLPEIGWKKKGKPLPMGRTQYLNYGKTLKIRKVEFDDEDTYECTASNGIGIVQTRAMTVTVQAKPYWISEPSDKNAAEDEDVEFECKASGVPEPEVKWFINGVPLNEAKPNPRRKVLSPTSILIEKLEKTDTAVYQCNASNIHGYIFKNFYINVFEQVRIIVKPEDYEVPAGRSVIFQCSAAADSDLEYQILWLKDDQIIDFDQDIQLFKSINISLFIPKATILYSGKYTCFVSSPVRNVSADAMLIVQDVPNPPKMIDVQCNSRTAIIKWQPMGDNRAPILSYRILYNTNFKPNIWEVDSISVPASDLKYEFALSPWANYSFRVVAINKIGNSWPSNPSTSCQSPPDVPHINPMNVTSKGTTPSNLMISWTPMPPIQHNAPGFFYRVYYRVNNPGNVWMPPIDIHDWKRSWYEVIDQKPFKEYLIMVEAHNEMGLANVAAMQVIGHSGKEDKPVVEEF